MALSVTVVNVGQGLRTVAFDEGKDGAFYLEKAGVTGWDGGTVMINNIPENGEGGQVQTIKAGDYISVAPKNFKSGR